VNDLTLLRIMNRLLEVGIPTNVAEAISNAVDCYSTMLEHEPETSDAGSEYELGLIKAIEEWANSENIRG